MCCSSRKTSQSQSSTTNQPKVVQEVQAQDQNTDKTKNVNLVEMIRSMGLHAKNPQNANIQEMAIVCELIDMNPVFYTPVHTEIVMTIWEDCQEIMEREVCVAIPVERYIFETKQINMITVHDMEFEKCPLLQCVYQWTDSASKARHWGQS